MEIRFLQAVVVKFNPNTKESQSDENQYHVLNFPTAPPEEELPTNNNYDINDLSSESNPDIEEID